jgi:hypothetical protein
MRNIFLTVSSVLEIILTGVGLAATILALSGKIEFPQEEIITNEFICTDTACEHSQVPGGAVDIPNAFNKERKPEDV